MKLQIKPTYKQHLAFTALMDKVTEYILFGGGANGGKTWLGWLWLITMCIQYPDTRYFVGREELKRLKGSTLVTFFKVCSFYKISQTEYNYNTQEHYITFSNGSLIDLLDLKYLPSDPLYERYGSIEYTSGWIEEAGEVHFDAYDTLKSRINRYNNDMYGILGKLYITCNPKRNWLFNEFYKPFVNGLLSKNKAFIQSLITDNDFREEGSIDKLKGITNKAKRERLLFGNWNYEDEPDQLIPYEWLDKAQDVPLVPGKKSLGVDVARYGDDSTILARMSGNALMGLKEEKGIPIDRVADLVIKEAATNKIDADKIGIDGVGLGAGVVDILKRQGFKVKDIISGAKMVLTNDNEGYKFNNLRSQMWWTFREELRKEEIRIEAKDDTLYEDLSAPKYEIQGDKTIIIESKDEIKKRIGRSPDKGDAAVYANWVRKIRTRKNIITSEIY